MAINYKTLGDRIKTKRISQGITQEKFAEHMDVSVGYISQLERDISKVSLERLVSIFAQIGSVSDNHVLPDLMQQHPARSTLIEV